MKTFRLPYDSTREVEFKLLRVVKSKLLKLPLISPHELLKDPVKVQFIDLNQVNGNTSLLEQIIITSIAVKHNSKRVFEFGTFDGKTSANLALNLSDDAEIVTIDLPASDIENAILPLGKGDLQFILKRSIGEKYEQVSSKIKQLYGDTAKYDFSSYFGTCDYVFVDACHEYEYVLNDSEVAVNLLKPGGTIIWHDYGIWAGVTRALNHLHTQNSRFCNLRHISGTSLVILEDNF